jgi:hypothetical protein
MQSSSIIFPIFSSIKMLIQSGINSDWSGYSSRSKIVKYLFQGIFGCLTKAAKYGLND